MFIFCRGEGKLCTNRFQVTLYSFTSFLFVHRLDIFFSNHRFPIGHITDDDTIKFLKTCQSNLTENGKIVIKDNVNSQKACLLDEQDSSVTRDPSSLLSLVKESGLKCETVLYQKDFPVQGLLPVIFMVCS